MKISKRTFNEMAAPRREEAAGRVHALLAERGTEVAPEVVGRHVARAQAYGIHDEKELTVYVECVLTIEKSGFDMRKVERLMSDEQLSRDHKLIPLRMLADSVARGEV